LKCQAGADVDIGAENACNANDASDVTIVDTVNTVDASDVNADVTGWCG